MSTIGATEGVIMPTIMIAHIANMRPKWPALHAPGCGAAICAIPGIPAIPEPAMSFMAGCAAIIAVWIWKRYAQASAAIAKSAVPTMMRSRLRTATSAASSVVISE
jgi:hypothetical protein